MRGRCLHYGDGVTFWPLVEILMQLGEPAAEVLDRISEGGAAPPRSCSGTSAGCSSSSPPQRPLVAIFDDLHWAEPMLLDLLDHIADLSRGVPILLLCIARPELLDERPGWGGGKVNATTCCSSRSARPSAKLLLDGLGDGLPADRAADRRASGGNPLFLEEMVALVRDGGGDATSFRRRSARCSTRGSSASATRALGARARRRRGRGLPPPCRSARSPTTRAASTSGSRRSCARS